MTVRPLAQRDLDEADRIFRLAFGTFLGLPDPMKFAGDSDCVRTRWRAAPEAAVGAYDGEQLIGSNLLTRWGSFGFFGPLTVRPDRWDAGVARRLLDATMETFAGWGVSDVGLFTFSQSTKHVGLYQKYGFWPQRLTALMTKSTASALPEGSGRDSAGSDTMQACRALSDRIHPGLDLSSEIEALKAQDLGELVLLQDEAELVGFAVMHCGAATEAGSGTAYVKFGAARDAASFGRLLKAAESTARRRGLEQLVAGINTARSGAYRQMLAHGYRSTFLGVAMQLHDRPGFNRPDCFVIDDWR